MEKENLMMRLTAILLILLLSMPIFAETNGALNSSFVYSYDIVYHNPAGIVIPGRSLASAGSRLLWMGLDHDQLIEGFGSYSQPLGRNAALGLRGTLFSSNMFQEGNASLLLGYAFLRGRLGIGLNANLMTRSYDRDRFQLEDPGDPLLSGSLSRTMFSYGFGLVLRPFGRLLLGASIDHVNRPDISLSGTGVLMERSIKAGVTLDAYGLKPQADIHLLGDDLLVQLGLRQTFLNPNLDVFAGLDFSNSGKRDLLIQAGYCAGNFGVRYDYQFPLSYMNRITHGSHSVILLYSHGGRISGSIRPTITITKGIRRVVRNESVNVEGLVTHEVGLTRVDILNNEEIVQSLRFDGPRRSVMLNEPVPLSEGDNIIRVVAMAGMDERKITIETRYRPYLSPPQITIQSSRPVAADSSIYVLKATVSDPNKIDRVIVYNNSRKVKRFELHETRTSFEFELPISLDAGSNVIIVFAANRADSRFEQFEMMYRPNDYSP